MYGMVNQGIRQFVVENHGPDVWREIYLHAGLNSGDFEMMLSYDDAVTYKLVGSICDRLDLETSDVLRVFGEYWIEFSKNSAVGRLIDFGGDSLVEILASLDEMHERFTAAMPHLKPPSFELEEMSRSLYRLHYHSERPGLSPMVIGLLHGLAAQRGEEIRVRHMLHKAAGADHDVFEIALLAEERSSDAAA